MEFKSGMLGCCVVLLIMAGAIFGTILISADANTYDVTKYRFETEVTGLFPVDNSPEFMDYDLARNYTGYYTKNTVINNVKYWGGATFTPTGVNNYPIRYGPTTEAQYSITMTASQASNMTNSDIPGNADGYNSTLGIWYSHTPYSENPHGSVAKANSKTLLSVIEELGLNTYEIIEMKTIYTTIPDWPSFEPDLWLYFGTVDDFGTNVPNMQPNHYGAKYVEKEYYSTYPQDQNYKIACHSCKIDLTTNTVKYYYNDTTVEGAYVRTVNLNDAILSYHYTITTGIPGVYGEGLPISIYQHNDDIIDYMKISDGVTITGVVI